MRRINAQSGRKINQVILLFDYDLPQDFAQRELSHRIRLADAIAVVLDGLPLIIQISSQHLLGFVAQLHRLGGCQ